VAKFLTTSIQNANLARAEARAASRIVDRILLIQKHRLDTGGFKNLPAPSVGSDFFCPGVLAPAASHRVGSLVRERAAADGKTGSGYGEACYFVGRALVRMNGCSNEQ
jgi:hypothetical protein